MPERKTITSEEREILRKKLKRRRRKIKQFSLITWLLMFVFSLLIFFVIKGFNVLPGKFLVLILALLLIVDVIGFIFAALPMFKNWIKITQSIVCVALSVLMLVGCITLPSIKGKLERAFVKVPNEGALSINVYVLSDSNYNDIESLAGKTVAVQKDIDLDYQSYAVKVVNKEIEGEDIVVTQANDIYTAVEMLYANEVDAIMLNEAYANIIEDNDDFADFNKKVRSIYTCVQKVTLVDATTSVSNLTKQTFTIGVTGVDEWNYNYIKADAQVRSDVNILLVVNPVTKQILMITVPRDAYVKLVSDKSVFGQDKITHSPMTRQRINCWVETMGNLLNCDINYYLRVNFSSVKDIVDALGGIDVNNPYYFETKAAIYGENDESYPLERFPEGMVHLDGRLALGYCRERYYVRDTGEMVGDLGRNLHQSLVLKAAIKKACSVSVISRIGDLLDAVEGKFTTNITMNDIYALCQMQLDDMSDWELKTYSLTGSSIWAVGYMMPDTELSMVEIDNYSLEQARSLISQMVQGEKIQID